MKSRVIISIILLLVLCTACGGNTNKSENNTGYVPDAQPVEDNSAYAKDPNNVIPAVSVSQTGTPFGTPGAIDVLPEPDNSNEITNAGIIDNGMSDDPLIFNVYGNTYYTIDEALDELIILSETSGYKGTQREFFAKNDLNGFYYYSDSHYGYESYYDGVYFFSDDECFKDRRCISVKFISRYNSSEVNELAGELFKVLISSRPGLLTGVTDEALCYENDDHVCYELEHDGNILRFYPWDEGEYYSDFLMNFQITESGESIPEAQISPSKLYDNYTKPETLEFVFDEKVSELKIFDNKDLFDLLYDNTIEIVRREYGAVDENEYAAYICKYGNSEIELVDGFFYCTVGIETDLIIDPEYNLDFNKIKSLVPNGFSIDGPLYINDECAFFYNISLKDYFLSIGANEDGTVPPEGITYVEFPAKYN